MKSLVENLSLKIKPLAFESFGVRSMCTIVKTPDVTIMIDPGVSLGKRFGLLPHPKEYRVLKKLRRQLIKKAREADVLAITHYHFDHFTPLNYTDYTWTWTTPNTSTKIYEGKIMLTKDYRDKINFNQRRRGWIFNRNVVEVAEKVEIADGKTFQFGKTKVKFSEPVWHGEAGTPLGWVIMVSIEHGESKVLHASDVQGPIDEQTLQIIINENPNLLIIGGPPTYLLNNRVKEQSVSKAVQNLKSIVKEIPIIILDHHLLRDINWKKYVREVVKTAEKLNHKIVTAAEFLGKRNRLLEGKRRELYKKQPPKEEFINWTKMKREERKKTPPPIK